jgi:glycosyltransferase involved in cell wall biosynthesis
VAETAHELGARVIAVHHGSGELNAAGVPGPMRIYLPAFRAWIRHAYARVDGVMSVVDPRRDSGRAASMPLRFGVDTAFRPRPALPRRPHVLYAGRLGREKGVFEVLNAAARSREPWRVHLVGSGPAERVLAARARRLAIADRVLFLPWVPDRPRLARLYAEASCVAMPGAHETFGLVPLEAAASGGNVVACETAPSAALLGGVAETFAAGDSRGLLAAIERARRRRPDLRVAAELAAAHTWERAFADELRDLERMCAR